MALTADIGTDTGSLFVGEDKELLLEVIDHNGVPVDITTWTILFDVRKKDGSPDPALISMTASIVGSFNSVRTINTIRARVLLTDTQMNSLKKHTYRHSWKRMDDGSEVVLAWGDFAPDKATAP